MTAASRKYPQLVDIKSVIGTKSLITAKSFITTVTSVAALLGSAASVGAQAVDPWSGAFEAGISGSWGGGYDLGSNKASVIRNEVPSGGSFTLFETASEARSFGFMEARVGRRLGRLLTLEARLGYGRPQIRTTVSQDAEASDVSFSTRLSQYVVDASALINLPRLAFRDARGVPFVAAGAGYLRELSESRANVDTGRLYHAGGGLRFRIIGRSSGLLKDLGLRGDLRVYIRDGGFEIAHRRRSFVAGGAGAFITF